MRKSKETNSSSLKADAWHHRSDAITSVLAFVGISVAILFGDGFEAADDVAALIASGIIIYNAYRIFKPIISEISDEQIYEELSNEIIQISKSVSDVIAIEKIHVRKMGMVYYVDLHLIVNANFTVMQGHAIAHNLKDEVRKRLPEIADVLIHVEPDRVVVH